MKYCITVILLSFDYENAGYQAADLIKMDILLNGRPVEELVTIVHRYCLKSWRSSDAVKFKCLSLLGKNLLICLRRCDSDAA